MITLISGQELVELCPYCENELHFQCDHNTNASTELQCCCTLAAIAKAAKAIETELAAIPDEPVVKATIGDIAELETPTAGRPRKTGDFVNALTAGRQRALREYKIKEGQLCAWSWMLVCGGGIEPVTGCTGRPAVDIHHGPDKGALNNGTDNISVICRHCHQLWHHKNDQYYTKARPANGAPWLPDKGEKVYPLSDMRPVASQNDITTVVVQELSLARPDIKPYKDEHGKIKTDKLGVDKG